VADQAFMLVIGEMLKAAAWTIVCTPVAVLLAALYHIATKRHDAE